MTSTWVQRPIRQLPGSQPVTHTRRFIPYCLGSPYTSRLQQYLPASTYAGSSSRRGSPRRYVRQFLQTNI